MERTRISSNEQMFSSKYAIQRAELERALNRVSHFETMRDELIRKVDALENANSDLERRIQIIPLAENPLAHEGSSHPSSIGFRQDQSSLDGNESADTEFAGSALNSSMLANWPLEQE